MTNKNGQSSTIGHLLRRGDNIYDGIYQSSGEMYRPAKTPQLAEAQNRLWSKGLSVYEFLLYLTHYSRQDCDDDALQGLHSGVAIGTPNMEILQKHNFWATSPALWKSFGKWKTIRDEDLAMKYRLHKDSFANKIKAFGEKYIYHFLSTDALQAGPVFTIDLAIMNINAKDMDISKILKLYSPWTKWTIIGCPEYLNHCHYLKQSMEEQTDGISRIIFDDPR